MDYVLRRNYLKFWCLVCGKGQRLYMSIWRSCTRRGLRTWREETSEMNSSCTSTRGRRNKAIGPLFCVAVSSLNSDLHHFAGYGSFLRTARCCRIVRTAHQGRDGQRWRREVKKKKASDRTGQLPYAIYEKTVHRRKKLFIKMRKFDFPVLNSCIRRAEYR